MNPRISLEISSLISRKDTGIISSVFIKLIKCPRCFKTIEIKKQRLSHLFEIKCNSFLFSKKASKSTCSKKLFDAH